MHPIRDRMNAIGSRIVLVLRTVNACRWWHESRPKDSAFDRASYECVSATRLRVACAHPPTRFVFCALHVGPPNTRFMPTTASRLAWPARSRAPAGAAQLLL
jgi:hypothetical protein